MLALGPGDILSLESGIVLRSIPGQDFYYAFGVVAGEQYRLNRTSFWVLEQIKPGIPWPVLRESFLETFDVPAKQCERDLRQLVKSLEEQKLIRREQK